jgi:branched-chain amino acid transport system substrate-binding protein
MFLFVALVLIASLLLSACGQAAATTQAPQTTQETQNTPESKPTTAVQATPEPKATSTTEPTQPTAKEVKAVIGFTTSQTGNLNVESTRQSNGLNLWIKQVNDAGGIKLKDGSVVKFETKFYDDESNKDKVQELYTRLSTEDNATFLISPYSSGLADAAAVIAEQYGKIMLTTGAASDSTYKKGYTLVYQAYTPASKYLTGAIDFIMANDPSTKKIAIVHENDKFSTDVANAVNEYAKQKGFDIVMFEGYDTGTADFAPFINKIQQASPDAILGGGHFQDGSTFAKQLAEKNVAAKFVALLVAPPEPTFAEIGDAALGIVGPSQWEPLAAFTPDYGPTGADFVSAYKAAYNEDPSYHSAGGYAAGLILQKAIETAGSLDTKALVSALDSIDMMTFYGKIKFNTTPEAHGLQVGHSMVYIQWQKGADGKLAKQVVWPAEGKTADPIIPVR